MLIKVKLTICIVFLEPANGYEKVHAHIPFMGTNVLKKVPGTEKGLFTITCM